VKWDVLVDENSVVFCPPGSRRAWKLGICDENHTILRENVKTRETVVLARYCASPGDDPESEHLPKLCVLDECVPAGQYRYGPERASECDGEYFAEVTISEDLGRCTRSKGNPGPKRYDGVPPWHFWWGIARHVDCATGCSVSTTSLGVVGFQLAVLLVGLASLRARKRRR
jgi:hypothetical protein